MTDIPKVAKYPLAWRLMHWTMALMMLVLIPIGIVMAERAEANLWGELTDTLYAWHKAIGFAVMLLVIVRIVIKVRMTAPAYPDTLPRALQIAAKASHHLIYALLVVVPLLGWAGVTAFPALVTLGGYDLPAMPLIPQSTDLAAQLFGLHGTLAIVLTVLLIGHIGAAFRHMFKKDGIFRRMV